MKSILSIALFLCIPFVQFAQESDCSNFKTGEFQIIDQDGPGTLIKRTKKYQYETGSDGLKIKLKIEWPDDCTYTLTFVKGNKVWKEKNPTTTSKKLVVRITSTSENSYEQASQFEGSDMEPYFSKVVKI